ncbi:hypothetical protein LBMAG53_20960 [Planctomycetota bacterium]|nr:hypothetical protein LBMAG53_20960 [Planctomycetota bacterium]
MTRPDPRGDRFRIIPDGIAWDVIWPTGIPHADHVELSGRQISAILRWTVDSRCCLRLVRQIYWPGLRSRKDDVRGYLCREFGDDAEPAILIEGIEERMVALKIKTVVIDGTFTAIHHPRRGVQLERRIFPSTTGPALIERWILSNVSDRPVAVGLGGVDYRRTSRGVAGANRIQIRSVPTEFTLAPGERRSVGFAITALADGVEEPRVDVEAEEDRRRSRLREIAPLALTTPQPVLDRFFQMCSIRAGEALFDTSRGVVHSPGGGDFYGGIWANDQIEYAAPWFAQIGDNAAVQATLNACRIFAAAMPADGSAMPGAFDSVELPSNPGGDRGDAAMYLSGVSRFLLLLGDDAIARELWPALSWCAERCRRLTTPAGLVASDSDELEGRFSTGTANLNTNCLALDGYRHAALLARDLAMPAIAADLEQRASALALAIAAQFSATVQGFDTYRYHDGCEVLRGWIGLPLAVGLHERTDGTIRALLSEPMLTADGVRTQQGSPTVWDRTTFYALKGFILSGRMAEALPVLLSICRRRLLGDHVPYAWECDSGQLHLAAESTLFLRLVSEGLFGLESVGLGRARIRPHLPADWPRMELRGVLVGGVRHDLTVRRNDSGAVVADIDSGSSPPRIRS